MALLSRLIHCLPRVLVICGRAAKQYDGGGGVTRAIIAEIVVGVNHGGD